MKIIINDNKLYSGIPAIIICDDNDNWLLCFEYAVSEIVPIFHLFYYKFIVYDYEFDPSINKYILDTFSNLTHFKQIPTKFDLVE